MTANVRDRDHRDWPSCGGENNHYSASVATEHQRQRARQLLMNEIAFVPNAEFRHAEWHVSASSDLDSLVTATPRICLPPRDLPSHLARLGATPLLSAEQERDLFRQLNFLKYQANVLRTTLDPDRPDVAAIEAAEQLLESARLVRDLLVRANMRLVMSVAKRFVRPRNSFDEALSDGFLTLLKAVDKFDYSRGFRFSTYAHRALTSNTYRAIAVQSNREKHFVQWPATVLDMAGEGEPATLSEQRWESLQDAIAAMLTKISPRDQFIVCGRFAIGSRDEARTFQSLADELGLSKERVRQIEQRAMEQLREIATEMGLVEWLDAALAIVHLDSNSKATIRRIAK